MYIKSQPRNPFANGKKKRLLHVNSQKKELHRAPLISSHWLIITYKNRHREYQCRQAKNKVLAKPKAQTQSDVITKQCKKAFGLAETAKMIRLMGCFHFISVHLTFVWHMYCVCFAVFDDDLTPNAFICYSQYYRKNYIFSDLKRFNISLCWTLKSISSKLHWGPWNIMSYSASNFAQCGPTWTQIFVPKL